MERTEEVRIADGSGQIAELGEENAEDESECEEEHAFELREGLLLFFVGAAVFNAHAARKMQRGDRGLHALDAGTEVDAFESAGDGDVALQIFAANLLLAGVVLDGGEGAEGRGLAGCAVQDGVLNGVERGAMLVVEADANGVGASVLDNAVCNRLRPR